MGRPIRWDGALGAILRAETQSPLGSKRFSLTLNGVQGTADPDGDVNAAASLNIQSAVFVALP